MNTNENRSALYIQLMITLLSLSVFFVPFGDITDYSNYFFINTGYSLTIVGLIFFFQVFNIYLNKKNGSSYENSYFLSTAILPLLAAVYFIFYFVESRLFLDNNLLQYAYIIIASAMSFITILYFSLRVDQRYSLRRVSKENNITINSNAVIAVAGMTLLFYLIESVLYFVVSENGILSRYWYSLILLHLVISGIYLALYFINQSSIIINIKNRLYLYVSLSIASFLFFLWVYQYHVIDTFYYFTSYGFSDFSMLMNGVYNLVLLFAFPILRIVVGYYLFNQQSLAYNQGLSETRTSDQINYESSEHINASEELPSLDSNSSLNSNPSTALPFSNRSMSIKERFTQNKIVVIGSMLLMFVVYTIAFNSNFISIGGLDFFSFKFSDISLLLESFELLVNETNNIQTVISSYIFIIFFLQFASIVWQLFSKTAYKSPSFIAFVSVQTIHLVVITYVYFQLLQLNNELLEGFGIEVSILPGFGMILQFVLLGLGIFLVIKGDELIPRIISLVTKLNIPSSDFANITNKPLRNEYDPYRPEDNLSANSFKSQIVPETTTTNHSKNNDTYTDQLNNSNELSHSNNKSPSSFGSKVEQSSIEEKMRLLSKLYESGQITEEEYQKKRSELLDRI